MENYEILNPEMVLPWALLRMGSALKAGEQAKELDIFDRLRCSESLVETGVRNEPSKSWGTNIAGFIRIG